MDYKRSSAKVSYFWFSATVLLLLIAVLFAMRLEGWSFITTLYNVVVVFTDVGEIEHAPQTPSGQLLFILLSITSFVAASFLVAKITELFIEHALAENRHSLKLKHLISRMENHTIICGAGQVGLQIAEEMASFGTSFVVIESDAARIQLIKERQWAYVEGDALDEDTLKQAKIDQAQCLITALSTDSDNVFITLTARALNPQLYIVARSDQEETVKKLYRAGATRVVSPHQIGGMHMATMAHNPVLMDFIQSLLDTAHASHRIAEIEVSSKSQLKSATIKDSLSRQRYGITILCVYRKDEQLLSPNGDFVLEVGDRLILLGSKTQIEQVQRDYA